MSRLQCTLLAGLLVSCSAFSLRAVDPARDTSELAKLSLTEVTTKIKAKFGAHTPRIAVFPASDPTGKVTPSIAEPSLTLQGELIYQLRTAGAGQYFVLSKEALGNAFRSNNVDPQGVDFSNVQATAETLTTIQVDVGIVIQFSSENSAEAQASPNFSVAIKLVYKDGASDQINSSPDPIIIPPLTGLVSPRFNVEILVDNQPLPLKICKDTSSEFYNVLFLEISPSLVGKEYKIRLTNKGAPHLPGLDNAQDKLRIFAVSLMIDGVSSFYQSVAGGAPELTVTHPRNASKWVLAPPGYSVVGGDIVSIDPQTGALVSEGTAGSIKVAMAKPVAATSGDGSVRVIPGFQKNESTGNAFTFANASESAAALVGITNDVGMISAHFYAQKMANDTFPGIAQPNAGTKPGREVENKVFPVYVSKYDNPHEVWRIFYRIQGSPPIASNLQPFTN